MAGSMRDDPGAMSEEYPKQSDTKSLCEPCRDDGKQLPAVGLCIDCNEYLCTDCYNAHTKARSMIGHVLKEIEGSSKDNQNISSALEICKEHEHETVKWYCKSHNQVICDVCKQLDHRKCPELETISGISRGISSSGNFTQTKERLFQLQRSFQYILSEIIENGEDLGKCCEDVSEKITKQLSKITTKDKELTQSLKVTCDTMIEKIKSMLDVFTTLAEKGEDEPIFLATYKAKSQLQIFQKRLTSVRGDTKRTRYVYRQRVPLAHDNTSEVKQVVGQIIESLTAVSPEKMDGIGLKTSSDTEDCYISGMDTMSDNELVVVDRRNRKLKVIDVTSKAVLSELKLDISPWDLTRIDNKTVAITTYESSKSVIVSVPDVLTVQRNISKSDLSHCQGITCINDTLIVSCCSPRKQIQKLDIEGKVKQTIDDENEDGNVRFGDVKYFKHSPNTNTLYLSDITHNMVIRMTLDGEIVATYTHEHLEYPRGIIVGRDGRICVCSYRSHKIYEISSDLSKGKIILDEKDGISDPCSIMYNDKEHKLFVGSRNKDIIQVFRL